MEAIRFAHVSDTHLCKDYGNSSMKDVFEKCESPSNTLRNCLEKLEQQKLDFVLFTGDLIHEGTKEDYDYFFEIVKESLPTTKAVYALGNHDRKKPFFESMGLEEKTAYCHVEEIANLRIVVLDSAVEGQETGTISKEQEEWLAGILKNKTTEYGTILAFHHPIVWRTDAFSMQVSDELKEIIKNSDVRAIFCSIRMKTAWIFWKRYHSLQQILQHLVQKLHRRNSAWWRKPAIAFIHLQKTAGRCM